MAAIRDAARRETQSRVFAASEALFRERGFANTTIRDVAAAAGVSVGTVMAVGDKSTLLVAIFDRLIESVHQRRSGIETHGSASDRVMVLLDPFIALFTSRGELARAYASILVAGRHDSTVFTELAAMLVREIRAVFGPGSDTLAQAVYRAYLGTLFMWAAGGSDDPVVLREDLHHTLAALCPKEEKNQ
ncbi:TetR/AcrR family transcriptional regulator [Okibacterium endophyticum]